MRLLASACLVVTLVATSAQTPAPDYQSNPKFQKALAAAKQPGGKSQQDRYDAWQKAVKVSGNQCAPCLEQMLPLAQSLQQWKDMANAGAALAALPLPPKEKAVGSYYRGVALLHYNSDKPKKPDLEAANEAFAAVLQVAPDDKGTLFQNGRALALLGRDDEARAAFRHYLEVAGSRDTYRTRVTHFAENPHLATLPMAPAFTIHTTDGQEFTLDALAGKVVLLDFWASWCGPCRETLPRVRELAKKFTGQPFIVLSISIDRDDGAWKKAMQEEAMSWPQYRDADGKLADAYGAHSIPRFFTIDADGALQDVQVGSDASIEGEIRKLVKRASAAQTATPKEAAQGQ